MLLHKILLRFTTFLLLGMTLFLTLYVREPLTFGVRGVIGPSAFIVSLTDLDNVEVKPRDSQVKPRESWSSPPPRRSNPPSGDGTRSSCSSSSVANF
jgi:hypothetical protein